MKPSLPVKKNLAQRINESKKNYPLYENLLSLATKRKYIQTVLQPYYTTRNHLRNNVNKFSYTTYLFTLKAKQVELTAKNKYDLKIDLIKCLFLHQI